MDTQSSKYAAHIRRRLLSRIKFARAYLYEAQIALDADEPQSELDRLVIKAIKALTTPDP